MNKAAEYKYTINYKSADNGYHCTDPDGTNCYFHNGPNACYLWYADGKMIGLDVGHAIFHPFEAAVFLNLNNQTLTYDCEMPEFLIDNLKDTGDTKII